LLAGALRHPALVRAGKAATVSQVDYQRADCKDGRTIEAWLKDAVGDTARSIKWSGGACLLANKQSPRDAGTKWCPSRHHVEEGRLPAMVELFRCAKVGRSGNPSFRAARTKAGWDYARNLRLETTPEPTFQVRPHRNAMINEAGERIDPSGGLKSQTRVYSILAARRRCSRFETQTVGLWKHEIG
jgi:hypothetical protein